MQKMEEAGEILRFLLENCPTATSSHLQSRSHFSAMSVTMENTLFYLENFIEFMY